MSQLATAVAHTMVALCTVPEELPIGTNLALLHFLWMQISGSLLLSRRALFPSAAGNWSAACADTAGLSRLPLWVLAMNFTAPRNDLPIYKGRGCRPKYGNLVRPLARQGRKGHLIPVPPDQMEAWTENERKFRAEFWNNLVLSNVKVHSDRRT